MSRETMALERGHLPAPPSGCQTLRPSARRRFRAVLVQHRGNVSRAAEELGASKPALYRLMKKDGVSGD